VRDILHVADLYDLIRRQVDDIGLHVGKTYNIGGGAEVSVSLAELTDLCVRRCQRVTTLGSDPETRAADIPWYVTDNTQVTAATGWRPTHGVEKIVDDIFDWLEAHAGELQPILR
jgi:CDP-paratose 2-epimerase